MPTTDLLSSILQFNSRRLSRSEKLILEAHFLIISYQALEADFKSRNESYFNLIKAYKKMEEPMRGAKLLTELIKDILATEEYTLAGIATHTHIPEDVLCDIVTGINTAPTIDLYKNLIELHICVRRDFYNNLISKILEEFMESKG